MSERPIRVGVHASLHDSARLVARLELLDSVPDRHVGCLAGVGINVTASVVVTALASWQSQPQVAFSYAPPLIAAVVYTSAPTGGGSFVNITVRHRVWFLVGSALTTLCLQGLNFGPGVPVPTVSIGGSACFVRREWVSQTKISCVLGAGFGRNLPLVVEVRPDPAGMS